LNFKRGDSGKAKCEEGDCVIRKADYTNLLQMSPLVVTEQRAPVKVSFIRCVVQVNDRHISDPVFGL